MADTAVQDPITQINTTSPNERDKNTAVPLEVMWERQFEQEQSLSQEKSDAVAEAQRIFSSTGSMLNQFKPLEVTSETIGIQVEDKQVKSSAFNQDMWMDMFKKPLENATNIAGTLINEAPTTVEAIQDLGQMILKGPELNQQNQPQMTQEKAEEVQINQWKQYRVGKIEETNRQVKIEERQQLMKAALLIPGGVTQESVVDLGYQGSFSQENILTRANIIALATKQSDRIEEAEDAQKAQDAAEVKQPVNLTNRLDAQEGQSAVSSSGAIFSAG